jgi:2,3-bisphosphoglycerate-independent phosphoglycerate mutase
MTTQTPDDYKYILLIPDGMADEPLPELDNRTPLAAAHTPHIDRVAKTGHVGWADTVPSGMAPGSDVACMSLFGYDPKVYHTGRASLEAASYGIELGDDDAVLRANFVTIQDGVMADYSAGHITTEESHQLINTLQEKLGTDAVQFHGGISYRNLLLAVGHARDHVHCVPPHEIAGQSIDTHWPSGGDSDWVQELMRASIDVLRDHPVNVQRRKDGKAEATMVWLWGLGTRPNFPFISARFGVEGSVITAVDLVRGLGVLAGLKYIQVPGATGYFDTDYKAKATYALAALELHAFVVVHVEATDEAGHMRNHQEKIKAIEAIDALVLGTLLQGCEDRGWTYRILISPDHPTLCRTGGHDGAPVPFCIGSNGDIVPSGIAAFDEATLRAHTSTVVPGYTLMEQLIHERMPT